MRAGDIINTMVTEYGYPPHVAKGIVSAWSSESGLNPSINERAPLIPGSRGGRGYYQLTGDRRNQFEGMYGDEYAPLDQIAFHDWELDNTEAAARDAIWATETPEEAATAYTKHFLRPGIDHSGSSAAKAAAIADIPLMPTMTSDMARASQWGEDLTPTEADVDEHFKQFDTALNTAGGGGAGGGGGMVARQQPMDFWSMMGQMPELEGLNRRQRTVGTLQDMFAMMRNPQADPYAIQNAMEDRVLAEQSRNQTAEVLQQMGRPDLANLVRAGQLDANKAATIAYDLAGRGSGSGVTYGTTPRQFTDPETGETYTGVIGSDGTVRRLEGDVSMGTSKVDAGTHWEIIDKQTGQVLRTVDKNAEEIAANEMKIKAAQDLNVYNSTLQEIIPTLQNISSVPEEAAQYALGKFGGNLTSANALGDQRAKPFITMHNQLQGQIFLDAYQQLKGGGQITEIEGLKAQQAKARMDRALTYDQYQEALQDYMQALIRGQERLQDLAAGKPIKLSKADEEWLRSAAARQAKKEAEEQLDEAEGGGAIPKW